MNEKPDRILYENVFCYLSEMTSVNYKVNGKPGHPYTIGAAHINAAQMNGGVIDESVCSAVPCAHRDHYGKCLDAYDKHTHDNVVFVYLKCNVSASRMQEFLKFVIDGDEYVDSVLPVGCDGFGFIDTGCRIIKDEA